MNNANSRTASETIDRLIESLGGATNVAEAAAQTVVATGWRHHPGWGTLPSKPEVAADFQYTLLEDAVRPRYRLSLQSDTYLVPAHLSYVETGNGSVGHLDGVDFMFSPTPVDVAISSWRVAIRQRHIDLTSVLRFAHKLMAPDVDVSLSEEDIDGDRTEVLTLREVGRPAVRAFLGVDGLPTEFRLVEDHSPRGDALVKVAFTEYRPAGRLVLPHRIEISVDDQVVHDETRSSIHVHEVSNDSDFDVPDSGVVDGTARQMTYALYSTQWVMTYVLSGIRFYFDLQIAPTTPNPVTIASGVKLIPGPSHNTLVVELVDSTLAVEAPLYDEYTRAALVQVKEAFPGKPLRTVVGTHFHYDHIGGIREFAADGDLTVIVGEPTVPFFQQIFNGSHTTNPDRYSTRPLPVTVQGVTDPVFLKTADGGEVQVYRMLSDHSDDMLIVYLTSSKCVFNSDLWNPTAKEPASGTQRGRLATQLYDAIIELGLDVESIIGGHSGTDGKNPIFTAPLKYLQAAAGR